ncbi:hypothetical protein ES703_60342 [subsurface metagenome]
MNRKQRRAAVNMGKLFFGFILIMVGLVLFPTIDDSVIEYGENATGATLAILKLIPLIWVLVVVGIGIGLVYEQFKDLD